MDDRAGLPRTRRFEILREIGSGGAGRVYLARDRYTGAGPLALKVFDAEGPMARVFQSLETEFLALRELSHPGLVRAYERGILPETGEPYYTSEYLDGTDFSSALAGAGEEEALDLVIQVLRVLEAVHRRGYVHCDLKPGNLLVTRSGEVKLLDFGLAVREGHVLKEGRLRGTLPYVAPETYAGRPVDRRADLYSLGAVLYLAMAENPPERGENLLPVFRRETLLEVAEPFGSLIHRLIDADPDRRLSSAARALQMLSSFVGEEIPVDTEESLRAQLSGVRFVGREVELGTLMTGLRNTVLGPGAEDARRLLLVRGEAGSGRSRLLLEFRDRCQREGVDTFVASCLDGEETAYAPLEPVIRALLARVGTDSPRALRYLPALSRILPELAAEEELPGLTGKEERLRWMEEVVRFMREAAHGRQGYVLVVEDAHRASFEMVELLGYLARSLCLVSGMGPPMLIVVSVREGAETSPELAELFSELNADGMLEPIQLRRFTEDEVREFVRAALGLDEPPKRLVRMLFKKTGGNIYFVEELMRALVEEGTIYYRSDTWRVGDLTRVPVPDSVVQVVERRLMSFAPEVRAVLDAVAAYGEPMPVAVLERLVPDAEAGIRDLLRRQVLVETGADRRLALRHSLVGQLVLERGDPKSLRDLHGRIGEVLGDLGATMGVRQEKIAHHLSLGEDRRLALREALVAARRLAEEGKHDQAAIFYSRAFARLERNDPRRPELLDALGDCHAAAGRADLAAATWRKALEETPPGPELCSIHRKLGEVLERMGSYDEALTHVRTGLDLVGPGDPAMRIPFLRLLGAIHRRQGDYSRAIECVREGLRLARGEPSEEVAALLSLLGNVHMLTGDHRKALKFHLRSLRYAQSLKFEAGAASALHNLGTLMQSWGATDRALQYFRDSLRITEEQMNLPAVALTYNNMANIYSETGAFDRSEYHHKRSLAIRRRIGDTFGIAMSFGNIGSLHRLRGQWGLARAYYERAIRHFERLGNDYGAAFFRSHLAELLLLIGSFDEVPELLDRAESTARDHKFNRIEARANLLRGRLLRHRGDPEAARRTLTRALEIDTQIAYREGLAEGHLEMALVHRDRGRRGQALREVARAIDEAQAGRSLPAEKSARFVRGLLGTATGPEGAGRALADLGDYIDYAREVGRSDALIEGLAARAGKALEAGDLGTATEDLKEVLLLTGRIAASLPEDLAEVYRQDPRRRELRELGEGIRTELERAGEDTGFLIEANRMNPENLVRLLEINKRLNSETDLSKLLDLIMDTAVEVTGAERGFLLLVEGKQIVAQVARNFRRKEVEEPELKISRSIVRHVMRTGETVLTDNATEDERFSKYRSVDNLKLTSILSVPFQTRGRQLGALYLDNQARKGVFTEDDVETLKALSDQAAIAIENLRQQLKLTEKLEAQDDELKRVRQALDDRPYKYDYDEIIGHSSRMKEVFLLLDKIIDTEVPVLIEGESGTGKELVARAIHYKGPRKAGPFVTVNAGAIPENLLESEFFGYVKGAFTGAGTDKIGLFEQAHGGTLFLDEIGDMDFDMQKKLLRVLQQGEVRPVGGKKTVKVDVRIVCATNKDLRQLMLESRFREDLFYRVNVISIRLPPLRDRREDIPSLVRHFVRKTAEEMNLPVKDVDQDAMALLTAYSWPGNVRELENESKKAVALSDETITAEDLSPHIAGERAGEQEPALVPQMGTLKETMEATEKTIIAKALEETGGNQTRAAKNLGISRVWLRKKMEKYGLLD